ncbi:hypothetical protein BKA57DRAFT_30046 [Linnemannia elongata]|nr:hypothetical protein BKA57DRAFT_30046 [Linnemannia elongata]
MWFSIPGRNWAILPAVHLFLHYIQTRTLLQIMYTVAVYIVGVGELRDPLFNNYDINSCRGNPRLDRHKKKEGDLLPTSNSSHTLSICIKACSN